MMGEVPQEDSPGARLKAERMKRHWTRSELAEMIKVDLKTIKRWENDQNVPLDDHVVRLSEIFGASVVARMGFAQKHVKAGRYNDDPRH